MSLNLVLVELWVPESHNSNSRYESDWLTIGRPLPNMSHETAAAKYIKWLKLADVSTMCFKGTCRLEEIHCRVDIHEQKEFFSNGDSLDCTLRLESLQTVPFDFVEIKVKGVCRVLQDHDHVGMTSMAVSFVRTLEMTREVIAIKVNQLMQFLVMYLDTEDFAEGVLPSPRRLEKNVPLSIPFHFTLPDQLLSTNCNCGNAAHHQLPPSMGDRTAPLDDVSSRMMSINYAIHVRLLRFQDDENQVLAQCQQSFYFLPKYPAAPARPLTVSCNMRQGIFKSRIGRLLLSSDHSVLRFGNRADKFSLQLVTTAPDPPIITSIKARLHIHNIYSILAMKETLNPEEALRDSRTSKHTETINLGSQKMRVSFDSNGQARVIFFVRAPPRHALPPSFAACNISRQYELSLAVGYSMGSGTFTFPVEVTHPDSPEAEDLPPDIFQDSYVAC